MKTAVRAAGLSAWCDGAAALGVPEGHQSCPGNRDYRLPGADPRTVPLAVYRCGCTCHTAQEAGR